jgi:flagellar biosynthetic protein FlhB
MDDKTEAPTPHRRAEAREKGQVSKSVEVNTAVLMLASFCLLSATGERFYFGLTTIMKRTFAQLPLFDFNPDNLFAGAMALGGFVMWIVAPFALILAAVAIVSNFLQVGWLLSAKTMQPDLNKINPMNGLKRIFSTRGFADLLKSIIKVAVVAFVIYLTLRDNFTGILGTNQMNLMAGITFLANLGIEVGFRVAMMMAALAFIDYFYQRYEHEKSLKMSKQEIREEQKRYENPTVKARIRSRQRQLALSRMMAAIPEADVVITNPTHLAIALRYEQGKAAAPVVVAKGQRLVAERIKEKAKQHRVPTVENKPLARTLFKMVEVGHPIPPDLFHAVAEVLAFVYRLKKKRTY